MDLTGMRSLLTADGWALLESLPPYAEHQAIALGEKLRTDGYDPATISAALTQSRLRHKAIAKLGPFAANMLFTPDGLEQATRLSVAAHHAQRFVTAGCTRVADLGCGLGSDAMAFASLDRAVLAIDADELTAAFATVNLRHWSAAEVRHHDVLSLDLGGMLEPTDGVWLDPARRVATGPGGRGATKRTYDPEAASPPYSFVLDVARKFPATGVKLAPGIPHRLLPENAEAQWVSVDGEAVECGLWFGPLARPGITRSALVLKGDSAAEFRGGAERVRAATDQLSGFLYEPDPAVIASGLVGELAVSLGLKLLDPAIAYLTGDAALSSPFLRGYAIEESQPYHVKSLRALLRNRGIGPLTIKKRGSAVDPELLRRQLRLTGTTHATIALTSIDGHTHVLLLRPLAL